MIDNLRQFVLEPGPEDYLVHCRVTRNNRGLDRGLYPTYFLHMERESGQPVFLLAGRKRKKCSTATYLLTTDPTDLSRGGESTIASLRSNVMGTAFSLSQGEPALHCRACSPGHSLHSGGSSSPASWPEDVSAPRAGSPELAAVMYRPNMLGMNGPRKMRVLLPRPGPAAHHRSAAGLLESYRARRPEGLLVLTSKDAQWDPALNSYVLNYHGRASQPSVKNFQLCHHSNPEFVLMQLGRVDTNIFNMDFRSPLSALQAFAIALSSFDGKLACE